MSYCNPVEHILHSVPSCFFPPRDSCTASKWPQSGAGDRLIILEPTCYEDVGLLAKAISLACRYPERQDKYHNSPRYHISKLFTYLDLSPSPIKPRCLILHTFEAIFADRFAETSRDKPILFLHIHNEMHKTSQCSPRWNAIRTEEAPANRFQAA